MSYVDGLVEAYRRSGAPIVVPALRTILLMLAPRNPNSPKSSAAARMIFSLVCVARACLSRDMVTSSLPGDPCPPRSDRSGVALSGTFLDPARRTRWRAHVHARVVVLHRIAGPAAVPTADGRLYSATCAFAMATAPRRPPP